ncbi:hypothetical protein ANO11243_055590 [Dothideomycetidae sp. 11243]|nr:hypothetical protein ANO11243_055590 [fungal sp. No.11243]
MPVVLEIFGKEQVRFTAGLRYNESKRLYAPYHEGPRYVGEASLDIDKAWTNLIGSAEVFVKPEDSYSLQKDTYIDPETQLYIAQ